MKILNEINFIIIYFAFFIYIINKIIISREKYHFAISVRDSWIRLSKPSKSRRRDHLRYFALFVNPDPCAQCKSGGDHLWQWWQQVRSWEHCVYSVPWGGGERERERESERGRESDILWKGPSVTRLLKPSSSQRYATERSGRGMHMYAYHSR